MSIGDKPAWPEPERYGIDGQVYTEEHGYRAQGMTYRQWLIGQIDVPWNKAVDEASTRMGNFTRKYVSFVRAEMRINEADAIIAALDKEADNEKGE